MDGHSIRQQNANQIASNRILSNPNKNGLRSLKCEIDPFLLLGVHVAFGDESCASWKKMRLYREVVKKMDFCRKKYYY